MQRKSENQGSGILETVNSSRIPAPPRDRAIDLVAVGENSVDLVCVTNHAVPADGKIALQLRRECPGGQAATVAVGCARLGCRVAYVGVVGDDPAGAVVEAALDREGVSATLVRRAGAATRTAVVIVNTPQATRSVLEYRDSALSVEAADVADGAFSRGRVLFVDASDLPLAIRAASVARQSGSRVVADLEAVAPGTEELLSLIDVPIVTEGFVRMLTGTTALATGLREIAERFSALAVVATLGAEGALTTCGGREIRTPARPVRAVDTTGAGDAFRAGFISAWLKADGWADLSALLNAGAAAAAFNCRTIGAQGGLAFLRDLEGAV
jgi:sugar/nucleoside kinase (ribokinase family)